MSRGNGESAALTAEIWFDFACPWCYLGKRRWEAALGRFPYSGRVWTRWRSYELRPGYSTVPARSLGEIMRSDWGISDGEVDAIVERVRANGRAEGLMLRPESVFPVSTFDAHRLVHLATERDLTLVMMERLFAAYHGEQLNIADRALLTDLAAEAGLSRAELNEFWRSGAYADVVRTDQARASAVRVREVPSYRIGERTVCGALGADDLLALLHESWSELAVSTDR